MIKYMDEIERDAALHVADLMAAAAKTAPKASGRDTIMTLIVSGEEQAQLCEKMEYLAEKYKAEFIHRDAKNVEKSHCVVLIAAKTPPSGIDHCGMCGFDNCGEMVKHNANCTFNITDLGIAVGSAASIAADNRMDNRVMYSAGRGAIECGFFPDDIRVCYAIPLFTGSKSIFFDRNPGAVLFD